MDKLRCVDPECRAFPVPRVGKELRFYPTPWNSRLHYIQCACGASGPRRDTPEAAIAAWKRVQERSNPERDCCTWAEDFYGRGRRIKAADTGSGEGE